MNTRYDDDQLDAMMDVINQIPLALYDEVRIVHNTGTRYCWLVDGKMQSIERLGARLRFCFSHVALGKVVTISQECLVLDSGKVVVENDSRSDYLGFSGAGIGPCNADEAVKHMVFLLNDAHEKYPTASRAKGRSHPLPSSETVLSTPKKAK